MPPRPRPDAPAPRRPTRSRRRPWRRPSVPPGWLAGALALAPGLPARAQPAALGTVPPAFETWAPWLGAALGILGGSWALLAQLRLQRERRARRQAEAEREDATARARQLSRQLDATLAALPDLLFEFDLAGRYVAVHVGQDSALLAAAPRQIIGRQVDELLPPEAAAIVHESLAAAQLHGHDQGRRIRLTLGDGRPRWFELASGRKPATGRDDDEHVLMLSRDITPLVQAEQQLAELRQALHDSRQAARHQVLFEQAPAPLAVLREGCIVSANPAFEALAGPVAPGTAVADWCRRGLADAQAMDSLARSWLFDGLARPDTTDDSGPGAGHDAARERTPERQAREADGDGTAAPATPVPHAASRPVLHLPWRGADGRRRMLQLHGRPTAEGCVLSLCDLSLETQDAELARAELRVATLQLQWLAASWGAPLRRMAAALGPATEQGAAAEAWQLLCDLQQLLEAVTEAGAPAAGPASAGRDPVHGTPPDHGAGGPAPTPSASPLGLVAAQALQRLARAGRARQRELVLQVDPAIADLPLASPAPWRALLLGLGHALLQASDDAGALVVALYPLATDAGRGWPTTRAGDAPASSAPRPGTDAAAVVPLRLELALQAPAQRPGPAPAAPAPPPAAARATAALAESLVRVLCERLGGRWARREPTAEVDAARTAWLVDLPLRPAPAPVPDTAVPQPGAAGARPALRALVIDDLPAARQALQQWLQAAGLNVTAVDDAAHALARLVTEQAGDQAPALICIDEQMPDMDGAALGLAIRALQLPGPPMLALFGRPGAGGALPEGFDARLDKPLQPRQLERLLQRLRPATPATPPVRGAAEEATDVEGGAGASGSGREPSAVETAPVSGPASTAAPGRPPAPALLRTAAEGPAPAPSRSFPGSFPQGLTRGPLPTPSPAPSATNARADSGDAAARPHVLVVDDNALNREVAADALRHAGIEVTTAEDGLVALEWLDDHRPDLILMDVQMPRLDGVRATEVLRGMPALRTVPVIALTANGAEEDRRRCLAAGMDDHLCKPVLPARLVQQVEHWLRQGRMPRPPQPAPVMAALLDADRGLALCGGGQALYRAMLGHFIDHQPAARTRLQEAWTRDDLRRVDHLVHTLKGSAAQIGALRLQQACEALEAATSAPPGPGRASGAPEADRGTAVEGAPAGARALLEVWDATVDAARQLLQAGD